MSKQPQKILILGRSGSGKSFSLHSLDPKKTAIINTDKQELSFGNPGYNTVVADQASGAPDFNKSNMVNTDKMSSVVATFDAWEAREDIDTIVIDTLTHLITADYVHNTIGKDFKSYQKMGKGVWMFLDKIRDSKKNVLVFGHIEHTFNDMGDRVLKMKTQGKMIDAFEPESYFTSLFYSEVVKDGEDINWQMKTLPTDVNDKVKSPAKIVEGTVVRALDAYEPNDMGAILTKLSNFYAN